MDQRHAVREIRYLERADRNLEFAVRRSVIQRFCWEAGADDTTSFRVSKGTSARAVDAGETIGSIGVEDRPVLRLGGAVGS